MKYFQDDPLGQCFHSMIVYGRPDGAEVMLAYFNKSVMRSQWSDKFELHQTHLPVYPLSIRDAVCAKLNRDTVLLGHETIQEVFQPSL